MERGNTKVEEEINKECKEGRREGKEEEWLYGGSTRKKQKRIYKKTG